MEDILYTLFLIYIALAIPAVICFILGLILLFNRPKTGKWLLIGAGIYVLVGLGVCGSMFLT